MADNLTPIVEQYFARLRDEHGLGAGTKERSYYRAGAADAQTYEALGLSRDAARERKSARTLKRGASKKLTPAMKPTPSGAEKKKTKRTSPPRRRTPRPT